MPEENKIRKRALRVRGLRQRWILNTIMPVFILLGLIVTLFSAVMSSYFYTSMQSGLEQKARTAAEFFKSYVMIITSPDSSYTWQCCPCH